MDIPAFHFYYQTQSFGTAITQLIPPREGYKARLNNLSYTAAGTVHDLVLMRALGETTASAAAAQGATTINVTAKSFVGTDLATGDYIVSLNSDDTYSLHLISGVSSLALTVASTPKAINANAPIWMIGAAADSSYHSVLKSIASTRVDFLGGEAGLAETGYDDGTYDRDGKGDPLVILSANGTAAGTLNWGSASYVRR